MKSFAPPTISLSRLHTNSHNKTAHVDQLSVDAGAKCGVFFSCRHKLKCIHSHPQSLMGGYSGEDWLVMPLTSRPLNSWLNFFHDTLCIWLCICHLAWYHVCTDSNEQQCCIWLCSLLSPREILLLFWWVGFLIGQEKCSECSQYIKANCVLHSGIDVSHSIITLYEMVHI